MPGSIESSAAAVFDHALAHDRLGASIFWVRVMAALGGEPPPLVSAARRPPTDRGELAEADVEPSQANRFFRPSLALRVMSRGCHAVVRPERGCDSI